MTDPAGEGELRVVLAELRREFATGLRERIDELRSALADLTVRIEPPTIERLHLRVHALQGTAAAYGADGISARATALAGRVRPWRDGGAPDPDDLAAAQELLDALALAVQAFCADVERSTP